LKAWETNIQPQCYNQLVLTKNSDDKEMKKIVWSFT